MRINRALGFVLVRLLALGILCSFFASPAQASNYSDGNASYQSGNYPAALSSYQQAAAQDSGSAKAVDLYKEGLTYHKLGRNPQAVQAYNQAQQADSDFAATHPNFQRNLEAAQRDSGRPVRSSDLRGATQAPGSPTFPSTPPHHNYTMDFIIFLIVVAVIAALLISASRRKKVEINTMRGPLEAQRESVLSGISYLDNYIDVLPKNNADSDQVRAFRQAAAYKLEQASKLLGQASDANSMMQAQSLLQQANSDVSNGRQYLDRATGGTGKFAGDDAVQPVPFPTNQAQVNQVPSDQRAVSFFSSQPAPVGALVPVTLMIDGRQRTVMATPQEAEQVRRGQIPPVRSFNVGGQNVPWYAYDQYDPYSDYYTYQNNGWRGVAGGAIAGFVGAELLGSLLSPHGYGGWNSPYAYGPGWDSWGGWGGYGWDGGGFGGGWGGGGYDQGYIQGEEMAHQQDYNNYGGGFGGGYDTSDYGNAGGGYYGGGGDRS